MCVYFMGGSMVEGPTYLFEPRHGICYLFLILAALCGFPAVTGLRVETGTNEQLHPAWLPGIMGLQTDWSSVCALFLHSHLAIPLLPCVQLIFTFRLLPFNGSIIFFSIFFYLGKSSILLFHSPYASPFLLVSFFTPICIILSLLL